LKVYNGGNAFWNERTAGASLMSGVVVTLAGVAAILSLNAYVVGSIAISMGTTLSVAAFLTYRW